jgi:hypothetical protein
VVANLKLAAFVPQHYQRTSCPMDAPANTLHPNNIQPFIGLKNAEEAYMATNAPPVLERIRQTHEHIENLDAHLLKTLGMTKTPLAYVTQEDKQVLLAAFDPAVDYATVQEEMIAQMDHQHAAFRADNIKVREIIRDSLHKTEAYNWIKSSKQRQDGCSKARTRHLIPSWNKPTANTS